MENSKIKRNLVILLNEITFNLGVLTGSKTKSDRDAQYSEIQETIRRIFKELTELNKNNEDEIMKCVTPIDKEVFIRKRESIAIMLYIYHWLLSMFDADCNVIGFSNKDSLNHTINICFAKDVMEKINEFISLINNYDDELKG